MPIPGLQGPDTIDLTYVDVEVTIDPTWLALQSADDPSVHMSDLWAQAWGSSSSGPPTAMQMLYSDFAQEDGGIGEQFSPNYAPVEIPGRVEAYQTFIGANNKTIELVFDYHAQVADGSGSGSGPTMYSPSWIVMVGRWFELLKQPVYDPASDISYPPPPVILHVGTLFYARCIMTEGSPQWKPPFDPGTMAPHGLHIEATFMVTRSFPTSAYSSIIPGGVPNWSQFVTFAGNTLGN